VALELRGLVLLRDFRRSDLDDFVALVDDDSMYEYMKFRLDEARTAQLFEIFVAEPDANPRRTWDLVVESPGGDFAGWAGLDARSEDGEAEVGWYLTSRHWGHGYATEATRLLIGFACGALGLRRVFATTDPENAASRRVIEKCGLSEVGLVENVQTWRGKRPRVMYEWICVGA
jgi:RimJ/RimL family protein N-acetyltransferase